MSVLNQSGEEQVECPLCMEPLEVDDLNFFPCTCGYQICRFCWHRIRLDENGGLCPACRKAYSENPADFIPLSQEQVAKLKSEKRQRDQQRKAKLTESRKHLASVRVVQRNLVFVVGLPPRLADAEMLKRHEYFGKFGKIHKVVINQSTSYAGSQGPSASAYVTYLKSEDALRAIQAVNNVTIDNRVIKSSLGTTKYCSHFMKNQSCPKPDCMYLHEYGDPEASFTKEQMHASKHQEYEKRLHDDLIARTKAQGQNGVEVGALGAKTEGKNGAQNGGGGGKGAKDAGNNHQNCKEGGGGGTNNRETWPQLDKEKKDSKDKSRKGKTKNNNSGAGSGDTTHQGRQKEKKDFCSSNNAKNTADTRVHNNNMETSNNKCNSQQINKLEARDPPEPTTVSPGLSSSSSISSSSSSSTSSSEPTPSPSPPHRNDSPPLSTTTAGMTTAPISVTSKLPAGLVSSSLQDDNTSFFSTGNSFRKLSTSIEKTSISSIPNGAAQLLLNGIEAAGDREHSLLDDVQHRRIEGEALRTEEEHTLGHQQVFTDSLPTINTNEDWVAAFGLVGHNTREHDLLQQKIQQQQREQQQMNKLSAFGGFGPLPGQDSAFGNKGLDSYSGFYEMSKMQENLMDALANKTNGLSLRQHDQTPQMPAQTTHINGLDQNMSKFFSDFHKFNSKEPPSHTPFQNGFNGLNSYHHNLLLQQKQIEEQLMNLGLKQNFGGTQNTVYQNGLGPQTPTYGSNGDSTLLNSGLNGLHSLYSKPQQPLLSPIQQTPQHSLNTEAELDFDPFQETQKALAELIEREQGHKTQHSNSDRNNSSQINGLVHNNNQNGSHLPPPPGFLRQQQQPQQAAHMNSFGSKILPYLNMSNSQQQIHSTSNNWPSSFNTSQMPQQPQQKNITNTCNDWKVLDPAILSTSSRNYQLPPQQPQMPPLRDHFTSNLLGQPPQIPQQPPQPQNNGAPPRLFDYQSANAFSNFSTEVMTSVNFSQLQQQQPPPPSYNNNNAFATHLNTQPNLTWYNSDLNSQISSPPGFRTSQTTKQQEC